MYEGPTLKPGAVPRVKRFAVLSVLAVAACGEDPAAPVPCGSLTQVTVNTGETTTATACFTDANGDMLSYTATSSVPAVATASISGTLITVRGVAPGNTSVTVTATDPGGLQAQQSFQVMVPNRAPQPRGTMPPVTVPAGRSNPVDAASYFTEPDGETLAYSATSSPPSVASVSVAGSTVTVTALAKGTANVTVTATDPGGLSATQTFQATVPNRAPEAGDPIPDMEVFVGDSEEVDASDHFTDPDGDRLTYEARSSRSGVATVSVSGSTVTVEAVAQGSAEVTVTASDPEGLDARQTFEVTVPNRAPVSVGTIPEMEVDPDSEEAVDVSVYFTDPDGDRLTYGASSSRSSTARVSVSGSTVTVTGVAKGTATVTVTARDPAGSTARQTFEVTVRNRAPKPVGTIADREVEAEDTEVVNVAAYFTDPDGDRLTYTAESSRPATARVSVSGSVVTVTGVVRGIATVTVTARDPEGLGATQVFLVTVPNRAPVAVGRIPDRTVQADDEEDVDVAAYFRDPDGDRLAFTAESSSRDNAWVSMSGSVVTVRGVAKGSATVTVTARDPRGLEATQTFRVTVPNRAPESVATIPDRTVGVDEPEDVDVDAYFRDPDGDRLTYSAESSSRATVRVRAVGSTVTITAVAQGTADITVTARDPEGLTARQTFEVTVANRAPVPVGTIPDRELSADEEEDVDVDAYFTDPDGDRLTYTAESSRPSTARVSVSGSVVTVRGVAKGAATVTVTARDPGGLTARQTFEVTVTVTSPDRAVLEELYDSLGGSGWTTNAHWKTDADLDRWFGVTTNGNERVVRLELPDNGLSGLIPASIGRMGALETLDLDSNRLAGALTEPMTALTNLRELWAGGTGLCAPADNPKIRAWLDRIPRKRIDSCDPGAVYLTQAVQLRDERDTVPLVAAEKAMLRVFLVAARNTNEHIPDVRARFYVGGRQVRVIDVRGKATAIPTEIDEGSLSKSANAEVPGATVQPGLEVVIEVDSVDASLGVPRRIPATGRMKVPVDSVPAFELTLVPFLNTSKPDSSIIDTVDDMADDPEDHDLLDETRTLLPVESLDVTAHAPVEIDSESGFAVLRATAALRVAEGGDGYYKGMMPEFSDVGGVAYVSAWSSASMAHGRVIAHELGHNLSLWHAPCGNPANVDPNYPHKDGSIGSWGYDFARERVVSPRTPDVMSYCWNGWWVSGYHFDKAFDHRVNDEGSKKGSSPRPPVRSLLLWGGTGPDGRPDLEPVFVVDAPPTLPAGSGDHRLRGLDAAGGELFAVRFDMPEIADGDGRSSFAFALPADPGWADALASVTLSGPGGAFTLDGDSDRPTAILLDPRTGQVRAILRDQARAQALAATLNADILFSRGVPDADAWRR